MGKLIDADAVIGIIGTTFTDREHGNPHFFNGLATAVEIIENTKEAVVRCKDCKFFSMTTLGMPFGACWHRADEINGLSGEDNGYTVCQRVDSPDFFCAWGERREEE